MNIFYKFLLLLLVAGLLPVSLQAQLPPNQPEQDCINALPVCQNTFVQPNSYQGEGLDPNEIDPGPSCMNSGERNDVWYIFTTQTAGLVGFSITPVNNNDDYDWAVYNLTNNSCADIFTTPALEVSCNWSGISGTTGPNGLPGGQNEPLIPVNAGETYVVNVSNFSGTGTGYTLDFSPSTATIFDNTPPTMDSVFVDCGSTNINVAFSENILCSSVDPTDFTITGPGGPFTVTAVNGDACNNGGTFEDIFNFTTTPAISQPGLYTISLVDTVVDNCGNPAILGSIDAFISGAAFTVTATPAVICQGQSSTLTTSFSNQPGYTFDWSNGSSDPNPVVSPNVSTIYDVTVTDPAGCVTTSSVTVTVNLLPNANFVAPPQACSGEAVSIAYAGNAGLLANYVWDFENAAIVLGSGPGPYQVTWNSTGPQTISLQVNENGCTGALATQVIEILEIPTSTIVGPNAVCEGDTALITYIGTAAPSAAFNWSFGGATYTENLGAPSGIGPYKVVWSTPGGKNVCLQVNNQGCNSTLTCIPVDVTERPDVDINQVANQCFDGNSFSFTTSGGPADSYFWNFGPSASPPTSTDAVPPMVTYLSPGVKTVSLVTSRNGCFGDSSIITFEVVEEPSADFTVSSASICTDSCITFAYAGTIQGPTQAFLWDFGSGAVPQTSSLPSPPCVEYVSGGVKTVTLTVTYRGCVVSTSQNVSVNAGPLVTAGTDREYCDGTGGVELDGSVSGGTQPYFYTWTCDNPPNCGIQNPNTEDPFVNPNIAAATETHEFYFQVFDVNGCPSNIDTVEVTTKAVPIMDAGPDIELCPKDAPGAFLQGGLAPNNAAPEPISYFWTPAAGLNDPTDNPNPYARPDTTTIYTLIGVSANGCTSEVNTLDPLSTTEVVVKPKPVAFAGQDTALCIGDSIQLQGFASGAGPNYEYVWTPALPGTIDNPNSPTPIVSPNATTTFTLTVLSNGCESDGDQVEVIVDTKPTVSAGTDETLCYGDSVALDGRAGGDPDGDQFVYSWSPATGLSDPGSATPLASPEVSTEYLLQVRSLFGCESATDTVLVEIEPTPEVDLLNLPETICEGEVITLTASHVFNSPSGGPVVYQWSPANFVISDPNDSIVQVRPTRTTRFVVKTSIADNDCPTTDEVLITVNPAVRASIEADTNRICANEALELRALGGRGSATYEWLPATGLDDPTSPNPLASPEVTTTYRVVISEGVCSDTAEFELLVNPAPQADYLSTLTEGCAPLTVVFEPQSGSATAYRWDFGDGSPMINAINPTHVFTDPGDYTVSLITSGEGGCESVSQEIAVSVSEPPAAAFASDPGPNTDLPLPGAEVLFTDQSQRAVNWFWDFGDGNFSNEASPIHRYERAGDYTVSLTITDEVGCVAEATQGPFPVVLPDLFVPTVFSPNNDGINDFFQIRYTGTETFSLQVHDRWGRQAFSADSQNSAWDGTTNGANMAEGTYYYVLTIGENRYTGNVTLLR